MSTTDLRCESLTESSSMVPVWDISPPFHSSLVAESQLFGEIILHDMPDSFRARESIWVPHILNDMKANEHTVLIGHSSGAEAAMRVAEQRKVKGLVLLAACETDCGNEDEAQSGYYDKPWDWDRIKSNTEWILQYHSKDDPMIPSSEAESVAMNLDSDFTMYEDKGHFMTSKDVEHIPADVRKKLQVRGNPEFVKQMLMSLKYTNSFKSVLKDKSSLT